MKAKNLMPLLLLVWLFGACGENRNEAKESRIVAENQAATDDPGASMDAWRDAWNKNNAQQLKDLTADDAVLLMWGRETSQGELDTWIDSTTSWMKNLRTEEIMGNRGENFAWEVGTYNHGTTRNDTLQMSGTYTMIWEREGEQGNNAWQVKVMDISPEVPEPPTPGAQQQQQQ